MPPKKHTNIADHIRCYEEAEAAFLGGQTLEEIADEYGVGMSCLEGWKKRYLWVEKSLVFKGNGKNAAELFRQLMARKVDAAHAAGGITRQHVRDVAEISKSLQVMDADTIGTAGIMTVIKDFSVWMRGKAKSPQEYNLVSTFLQMYLQEVLL